MVKCFLSVLKWAGAEFLFSMSVNTWFWRDSSKWKNSTFQALFLLWSSRLLNNTVCRWDFCWGLVLCRAACEAGCSRSTRPGGPCQEGRVTAPLLAISSFRTPSFPSHHWSWCGDIILCFHCIPSFRCFVCVFKAGDSGTHCSGVPAAPAVYQAATGWSLP